MSTRPSASTILVAIAFAAAGCTSPASRLVAHEYGPPLLPTPTLGSMRNVSLRESVWVGSHPSPEDLELANRRGIARTIDVSLPEERAGFDVAATCEKLGIEYVQVVPASSSTIPADDEIDRTLSALRRGGTRSTLLFSGSGDRAAMFLAVWRALDGGIGVDEAIHEARRSGMKPGAPVEFIRTQVARLSRGT
jgi:protein tyrosine phosphatase (PTP) superfamily phosphohydrolase (DUF442 family)